MNKPKIKDSLQNDGTPKSIGGQAVIEGVMMRGKKMYAIAVRKPSGEIILDKKDVNSLSDTYKILKLPILRGVVAFIESLVTGTKTITYSASLVDLEEEGDPSKFEQFLENKLGDKLNDYLIYFSVFISLFLGVAIFMLLPVWISSFFRPYMPGAWGLSVLEGFVRIGIFLLYTVLISQMKDIKRVFQYHGAEHKTINCFEHNETLTVDNVKKYTRLHRRCGTSFLLIVMVVSMIIFMFIRTDSILLRLVSRILLVPLTAGLSYEIIKWAGRSKSALVMLVSYPGMCLQKITTLEPDDSQIEIAIAAINSVLEAEGSS